MSEDTTEKPKAAKRPQGLGRGLSALLGDVSREEPVSPSTPQANGKAVQSIEVALIHPHPEQPRRHFDDGALQELADSIAKRGVIQPIIVRPHGGGFQIIAGERRWRAAQRAKLHEIPAIIRDLDQREVMAIALIENIQREDLNPIEEARAYQHLADEEGMSQAEIAELVDKSRSHVANHQRLLALPEKVIAYVERGQLSMGHARALIGHDAAEMLAEEAVTRNLSVRDVEKRVRSKGGASGRASSARPSKSGSHESEDIAAVERHLEEFLGMSLKIKPDADPSSGAITIKYKTLDQLDLLCQRLTGGKI